MSDFPFVPLTAYTGANESREVIMQRFAKDLKAWLKSVNLDWDFLSRNMDKSVGTIRNWMTGKIHVSDSRLDKILELCRAHVSGGRELIYGDFQNEGAIDYIWLRPYMRVVFAVGEDGEIAKVETPLEYSHNDAKRLYEKWCAAAGVPEDTLYDKKERHYPALARFVTDTIMAATQKALSEVYKEGMLNEEFMQNKGRLEDSGAVLQGIPCACNFFAGTKFGYDDYKAATGTDVRKDICFFLPVIKNEWRADFVRWAARFSESPTTDLWIVERLNEKSLSLVGVGLDDFMRQCYSD